jgi:Class II Aldolase and Adducin N-terminal domain
MLAFTVVQSTQSQLLEWFAAGLKRTLLNRGHAYENRSNGSGRNEEASRSGVGVGVSDGVIRLDSPIGLVINLTDVRCTRRIHRKGQGTFVVSVIEAESNDCPILNIAYPYLPRTLANLVICLRRERGEIQAHFVTLEQGHYQVGFQGGDETDFFDRVYKRLAPLANSHMVIKNVFEADLPESLWDGDAATKELTRLGKIIDAAGLLPSPFPVEQYLSAHDLRHIKHLFGLGGLSYGNMSTRAVHNRDRFWISASGVDKGNLQIIGRDILLVKGFDPEQQAILLTVPPNVEPRHASVDTIEHIMIYREHPEVGAILHVHSWWSDPIPVTETNYPCGTFELANEVADLVRQYGDPTQAIIGLKNHGLTITGTSISDILARILGKIVPQVPMV